MKNEVNDVQLIDLLATFRSGLDATLSINYLDAEEIYELKVPTFWQKDEWNDLVNDEDFQNKTVIFVNAFNDNGVCTLSIVVKDREEDR